MKKKSIIEFFKNGKNITILGCLVLVAFLGISNFNLVQKNIKYKEYLLQTMITLDQYDKELKIINDSMISIKSQILKCKG